mmetsp:Transcript_56343/g.163441  ORF Transcript_56343/g.163441 Transcript_56343/m.163441 type:complete len:437 (+) Transcript_56343:99-1409(+)
MWAATRPAMLGGLLGVAIAARLDVSALLETSVVAGSEFSPRQAWAGAATAAAAARGLGLTSAPLRAPRSAAALHASSWHDFSVLDIALEAQGLARVSANDLLLGKWRNHLIFLPSAWAKGLGTLSVLADDETEIFGEGKQFVGFARVTSTGQSVTIRALSRDAPATIRDVKFSSLLSNTGVAPAVFDVKEYDDTVYLLAESPGTRNLENFILQVWVQTGTQPTMPVRAVLPLMVDLARALVTLERFGITHGDLVEDNIYVVDQDRHALITDFDCSCMESHGDGQQLACDSCKSVSAFHSAPEMEDGTPTGVENNVWQMGLIFARMMLGETPTRSQAASWFPAGELDDQTVAGQQMIRARIRQRFAIDSLPSFMRLSKEHPNLAEILAGMLETDAHQRWTATRVLAGLLQAARDLDVTVPESRKPQPPPDASVDSAQ